MKPKKNTLQSLDAVNEDANSLELLADSLLVAVTELEAQKFAEAYVRISNVHALLGWIALDMKMRGAV